MTQQHIQLAVQAETAAEESRLLGELQTFLLRQSEHIQIERSRVNQDTQDPGTVLAVAILSAPAVVEMSRGIVELAKGIADWMRKRNVTVKISAEGGQSFEGPPEQVERIIREVLKHDPHRTR